jgi:hypothetical protein
MMKRLTVVVPVLPLLLVVVLFIGEPAQGGQIDTGRHYTWGISNTSLDIPDGCIITEAVLTIHNITNLNENENDTLHVRLLDDLSAGFAVSDSTEDNKFENQGLLLKPVYHDLTTGNEDLIYTFSDLNDESSVLWNVFNPKDPSTAGYSSLLLQLIDYAGNGTGFGFGFDPNGISTYIFEEITLDLTVESFRDQADQYLITLATSLSLIEPIGDKTVDEKQTLSFEVIATGSNGEPITCRAENIPEGATFDGNIFTWRPWYGDAGSCAVTFVASDGFCQDSQTITITVNPVKSADWYERWRKHLDSP